MKQVKDAEKKRFLGDQYEFLKDNIDWNYYGFKKELIADALKSMEDKMNKAKTKEDMSNTVEKIQAALKTQKLKGTFKSKFGKSSIWKWLD